MKELPDYTKLDEMFYIDPTSKTYLTWKSHKVRTHINKPAGYLNQKKNSPNDGRWMVSIKDSLFMVHRVVYSIHNKVNLNDGQVIDHIDGNSLNNNPANLRACSNKQNSWNRQKHKIGASLYKGVRRSTTKGKWFASISGIYLGTFETEILAAIAYNKEAYILFGEYANYNIVI